MTILLIDEDWSKADPVQLRAAGYTGVIGYVSEDTTGKNLTRAQVDAAHAAGLDVGLVYEYATVAAAQGANRGVRDAAIAVDQALALGAPAEVCLYAAVDFNPTPAQMPAVLAYLEAFQQYAAGAVYRAGAYGGYPTCQYLAQHGYTGLLWQTYAWSGGLWWPSAVLRQTLNHITVAGATVDRDEAESPDWGQWKAADMAFMDDPNAAALAWRVQGLVAGADTVQDGPTKGEPIALVRTLAEIQTGQAAPATVTLTDAEIEDIATLVIRKLFAIFAELGASPTAPTAPTAPTS